MRPHRLSDDKPVVRSMMPLREAEAALPHPGDSQIALPQRPSMTKSSDSKSKFTKKTNSSYMNRSVTSPSGTSVTFEAVTMASRTPLNSSNLSNPNARTIDPVPLNRVMTQTNPKHASSAKPWRNLGTRTDQTVGANLPTAQDRHALNRL